MTKETVTVLSIEDNPGDARLIQIKLGQAERAGWGLPHFEVIHANRLEKGLYHLNGGPLSIDVILTDLDLPDSRAGETFARLRAMAPDMPIVVLTGREDEELARESVRAGAQDYLFKAEATGSLLAHAITYAIERQQAKEAIQRAHDELEIRVRERTRELAQANETLQTEIRERKQVESVLCEREETLQFQAELLDQIQDEIVATDLEGRITYVNKAVTTMLGCSKEELTGQTVHVFGEDAQIGARQQDIIDTTLADGSWRGIVANQTADGVTKIIETRTWVVYDQDHTSTGMVGVSTDITEQRQVEEALQASEQRFKAIFNSANDAIWILQPDGYIIDVNDTSCALLGYTKEEMCSKHVSNFLPPDEVTDVTRRLARIREQGEAILELHHIKKDGSLLPVEINVKATDFGQGPVLLSVIRDLTARTQAQNTLRRERDRAQRYLDITPAIIIALDTQGHITLLNKAGADILECDQTSILGANWFETFLPEESKEEISTVFAQLMTGDAETVEYVESPILTQQGHEKIIRWHNTLLKNSKRENTGLLSSGEDITASAHAEQEVLHLNAVLNAMRKVDQLITAEKDRARALNGICETLVSTRGYASAWIALLAHNQQVTAYYESGLGEDFRPMAERLIQGNLTQCAHQALQQDKSVIVANPIEDCPDCPLSDHYEGRSALVIRLGHGGHIFGLLSVSIPSHFTANTDEHQLLEELASDIAYALYSLENAEARQHYEAEVRLHHHITSTITHPLAFVDHEYRYRTVNPAYVRFYDTAPKNIIGHTVADFLGQETFETDIKPHLDRCLAGKKVSYEVWADFPGIGRRCMLMHYVPFVEPTGHVRGVVSHGTDITQRKKAEEALARLASDLQHRNEDLQQFAYIVSHDLREPLRMVKSYLDLLRRDYEGRLDTTADEFIHFAVDGAKRMHQLIENLLKYTQVDLRDTAPSPTDSACVLRQVLNMLKFTLEEKQAVVTSDPLPIVMGDETLLIQLFQNLIGNALKFCNKPPRVHVAVHERDTLWQFAVRDTGIGIALPDQDKAFTLLQRLHPEEAYDGTGIGLAICKKIVERHGGKIWLESTIGQGSTFYFTLPKPHVVTR